MVIGMKGNSFGSRRQNSPQSRAEIPSPVYHWSRVRILADSIRPNLKRGSEEAAPPWGAAGNATGWLSDKKWECLPQADNIRKNGAPQKIFRGSNVRRPFPITRVSAVRGDVRSDVKIELEGERYDSLAQARRTGPCGRPRHGRTRLGAGLRPREGQVGRFQGSEGRAERQGGSPGRSRRPEGRPEGCRERPRGSEGRPSGAEEG